MLRPHLWSSEQDNATLSQQYGVPLLSIASCHWLAYSEPGRRFQEKGRYSVAKLEVCFCGKRRSSSWLTLEAADRLGDSTRYAVGFGDHDRARSLLCQTSPSRRKEVKECSCFRVQPKREREFAEGHRTTSAISAVAGTIP